MIRLRNVIILAVQVILLTAITLFCVMPFSCRLTEEGIVFVGGDYTAPVIETVEVLDERTVQMNFSEGINITSVIVSKMIEELSDSMEHSRDENLSPAIAAAGGEYGTINTTVQISEDSTSVKFIMEKDCEIGQRYEIYGVVEDKTGNTLSFCVPFTGYNSHVPKLIMTELLVKYGTGTKNKQTVYRNEFVELLALTDGNLAGLEIVSGSDGESKKYVIPPTEVCAGEIVLVHLRCAGEGCVSETENLNEATAPHSRNGVRDIWSENEGACLNDKTDVIILRNGTGEASGDSTGEILDAFMYAADDAVDWKNGPKTLAEKACAAGIYETADISEAISSKGVSPLQSFQRKNAAQLKAAAMAAMAESASATSAAGANWSGEFPVLNNAEYWEISEATPGVL